MEHDLPQMSVSDFVAVTNQTLEYAYPGVVIEGEVESFKINQGKFVFFNLKDSGASVGCFMMLFSLRVPVEDGMKVVVRARPKLTQWGKFSLSIDSIRPSGEGSIKKSFELLRQKLEKEGLFAADRKRMLPQLPARIGVISSTQAAGYADFIEIINQRWGGLDVLVRHTAVQGSEAADQIIHAIEYFNQLADPVEVLVIIRGGGSADDLAVFNDERLVRAISASRTPTLVGVGHEVDVTLADMVADVRAATPSNAAQIVVPDRREVIMRVEVLRRQLREHARRALDERLRYVTQCWQQAGVLLQNRVAQYEQRVQVLEKLLHHYNPVSVLRQGYAIIRGEPEVGAKITIETYRYNIEAKVTKHEAHITDN